MSNTPHVLHTIHQLMNDLPPIREKKSPFVAGILGFFLGGIGLGLYFRSFKDFLYPVLVFIGLSIVLPGLGTVAALLLTTLWGVIRAVNSGQ